MTSPLQKLNKRFRYKLDKDQYGRREHWTIMTNESGPLVGDCEDYSLTLLWYLEGKSFRDFWKALLSGKAEMWFCKVNGNGHAVLKYEGRWIDNGKKRWVDGFPEYDMKWKYPTLLIIWKLRRFLWDILWVKKVNKG